MRSASSAAYLQLSLPANGRQKVQATYSPQQAHRAADVAHKSFPACSSRVHLWRERWLGGRARSVAPLSAAIIVAQFKAVAIWRRHF